MKPAQGFSLLELMIGLIILATLLALALPAFDRLLQTQRADRLRDDLFADLALARAEAMARNQPVVICGSDNLFSDQPEQWECNGRRDWSNGWLLFTDLNGNKERDAGDVLIAVYEDTASDELSLGYNRPNPILFDSIGRAPGMAGSFELCGSHSNYQAKISLSGLGRIKFSQAECD